MNKILVPTDFSPNALKALTYAAEIAKKTGATVSLLHVIEPAINMATMQKDSLGKKALGECSQKLETSVLSFSAIYPDVAITQALAGGETVATILDFSTREQADLIVMGTTGASGLKELLVGSIAAGVISKTKTPVLTVPAAYEMEEPAVLLFATNQFEKNQGVLDKFVALAKMFSLTIHVTVFRDLEGNKNAELIYNEEQLNDYLKFLKQTFPGVSFRGKLLEGKDFELAIEAFSNQNMVDIITLITYPKTFFEKLFRKSMTRKMAFHSTTPILAIPGLPQYYPV